MRRSMKMAERTYPSTSHTKDRVRSKLAAAPATNSPCSTRVECTGVRRFALTTYGRERNRSRSVELMRSTPAAVRWMSLKMAGSVTP